MEGQGFKRKFLTKKKATKKYKPDTGIKGNTSSQKFIILKKQNNKNKDIFD